MSGNTSTTDVEVTLSPTSNTLRMQTKYGPIEFSYYPDQVKEGLSKLVSSLLDALRAEGSRKPTSYTTGNLNPLNGLQDHLKAFTVTSLDVPNSALNPLYKGRTPYLDGSLEQFIDNLPTAIALMISHLATTAILSNTNDIRKQGPETLESNEAELRRIILTHLCDSVRKLWNNADESNP